MVVVLRCGMSRHDGREVVMLCEECHSKMLAMGELLLLSCEARPVFTSPSDLELSKGTFVHYRDKVVDKLNHILIASRDVSSQVHSVHTVQWKSIAGRVQELGGLVTGLTELSAHIGYLVAVNFPRSHSPRLGVVNKYKLHQAKLDLKFCCSRLKRSCVDDLDAHLLVELCSTMSRALSSVTEVCRHAGERAADVDDQNQFKLCIKSVTSTTSCLIASVKRFKSSPGIDHLRRIIAFCDPVMSTSSALVTFASEEEFIGQPAKLSEKATEAHKSVLGMTMSIVSASIQMCKAIRDLVYDLSNARHRERIRLCVDSMDKASSKLRDLLLSCDFEPKAGATEPKSASPDKGGADNVKTGSPIIATTDSKGSDDAKTGPITPTTDAKGLADAKTSSVIATTDAKSSADVKTGSDNAKSSVDTKNGSDNTKTSLDVSTSNAKSSADAKTGSDDTKVSLDIATTDAKSSVEAKTSSTTDANNCSVDAKPGAVDAEQQPSPTDAKPASPESETDSSLESGTALVEVESESSEQTVDTEVETTSAEEAVHDDDDDDISNASSTDAGNGKADGEDQAAALLVSPSAEEIPAVMDAVSVDAYFGSGDGHHGNRLDLTAADSGDMEKAVTASGLMASSPVLNLSTYSVGSFSDVDQGSGVTD
ncbi:uncharacterized protein LOC143277943 [Babylonia areolata]|uniref:uncharacterized protein LOC143277943 n=1 Tax=Babylonia areolata TaxID=304850 RepID=UPI003FCFD2F0